MKTLRRHRAYLGALMIALVAFWQVVSPLQLSAATFYWDTDGSVGGNTVEGAGLGGTGAWNTSASNWWDLTSLTTWPNTNTDLAIFAGTAGTVTLDPGIVANGLSFRSNGYVLTGGTLTLAGVAPSIRVNMAETAYIDSELQGINGFTKTGVGHVYLRNATNSYTGTTTIADGSVVISDGGALGADTSAIVVTGSATRGFGGGALVLAGGYGTGMTLTRGVSLQGNGPLVANSAALISVGTNTITGLVTNGLPLVNTTIHSVSGRLTMTNFRVDGVAGTNFITLGAGNTVGVGSYAITGTLSGGGSIQKIGSGTLILDPTDASGFSGTLRISSGTIRVTSASALGTNAGTGTSGMLDLNGDGVFFEVRGDNLNLSKNVYQRAVSPSLFTDHAIGSSLINGTTTFGALAFEEAEVFTFNGRNGFNMTFTAAAVQGGTGDSTFTNNLTGLLTFTGNFWTNTDNTGARIMTVGGNGNTQINGSVVASSAAFDHSLVKTGTGTLTILGTASTLDGSVSISNGTIAITDFRSITNNSAILNLGATTTGGTLSVIGSNLALVNATSAKVMNLSGTTGGGTILANQTGTSPGLVLNGNITGATGGAKSLTLGGSATPENTLNGIISENSAANFVYLRKSGSSTWVLTGANTFTGSIGIFNGVLKLQDTFTVSSRNILGNTNTIGFGLEAAAVGSAGGTLHYAGAVGAASSETLGGLFAAAGAGTVKVTAGSGGTASLTFASLDAPITITGNPATSNSATVNVTSTAGLVAGMRVTNGASTAIVLAILNGTQITVSANQTVAAGASLVFDRPAGGGTVNFDPDANSTVTIGTVAAVGILSPYSYFRGADFAYAPSTTNAVLRAPVYGTDATFSVAGASLVGSAHNLVTGNTTTGATTVGTLKIAGSHTVTQTGLLIIRTGTAGTSGGILVTGGTATIAGAGGVSTSGAGDLYIRVNGAGDVLNLNTPVTAATTGSLVKTGAGTLVIGAQNAQTTGGTTQLLEGTIRMGAGGRLSANSVNFTMRQGTTFDLNGVSTLQTATTGSIGAFNGDGTVTNTGAAAVTFAVGGGSTGGTGTFNGSIIEVQGAGRISVVKLGTSNSQTWSGMSNYTGSTTIGVAGSTSGSVTVMNLANIGFDSSIGRGDDSTLATNRASLVFGGTTGGLIYAGTTSVNTDRLFTLAGTGVTLTNNSTQTLNFTNFNAFAFTVAGPQLLQLGGSSTGDNHFNPQITDSGIGANITSVNKLNGGKWVLGNSNNTYTGTTTITEGTLELKSATGSLPTASGLILGNTSTVGILEMSGTFTRNLVASASAGNNTVSWNTSLTTGGGGFAASTDKLVVSIGGVGTETVLQWGGGTGFVNTGSALVLNSTTALAEVEFRNGIDLNGGNRTITINDNTTTLTDYATITGVISNSTGTGNLTKGGGGTLQLLGANTYNGTTSHTSGTLVVNSLGNSGTPGVGTSVGTSTGANLSTQAILLGNGGTGGVSLQYIGTGETSDRMIRLNSTTGSIQIHSDGTGALILTNVVNDMVAGSKLLYLRGSNTQGNMVTSVLGNHVQGTDTLGVVVDSGATWILSGNNTYSGVTDVTAGAMGIGHDNAFGNSVVRLRNGSMFAYGADRTISNAMSNVSTTTAVTSTFLGDYSITMMGLYTHTNTTAGHTITNSIINGKMVTYNGDMVFNALTGGIILTINGSGDTVINGNITTSTAQNIALTYAGSGSGTLTLSGTGTDRNAGLLTVTGGTLKLGNNEVIAHGSATESGNVVINPAVGATAGLDLNGKTETVNGFSASGAGTIVIDNTSATAGHLIFGANDQSVDIGAGAGSYTVTDSGAGALSLTKIGSGSAMIGAGVTLTYQGTTNVTGGSMTIASALNGTTALSVTGTNSSLALTGGVAAPLAITSVVVGGGSTLSLLDGSGNKLTNLNSLTLGSSGGTNTFLNLNVGDSAFGDRLNTDQLGLLPGGTLALFAGNKITLNLTDAGLNANQTYNLILSADGGLTTGPLTAADWLLGGAPGGFSGISINATDTVISITTGNLIVGSLYWNAGGALDTWNDVTNWAQNKAGTTAATTTPGQGSDVFFVADNSPTGAIVTTLEQNFKVNSLTFEASTNPANTPTSVTINPGANPSNRLEVAPQAPGDGIRVTADGPQTVTLGVALRLGGDQTWDVASGTGVLTISGALFGAGDVTKEGLGKVTLGAAADATFNAGATVDVSVNAGTLEITNAGALGTQASGNLARLTISGGAFYMNNATSGVVGNSMLLAGGTLSVGGNAQTYSGAVEVGLDSSINMRDQNATTTTITARNITLSGLVSGAGALTIDSVDTVTSGNQVTGTLTLNQVNNGFSGDLRLLRGVVVGTNADALGSGAIFATAGRVSYTGIGGATYNLAKNITVANASGNGILEWNVDRTAGTDVFTVNNSGVVTLGGVGGTGELRILQSDGVNSVANLTGGVVLANNGRIAVRDGLTTVATISGVGISETGDPRTLTINDVATWGGTAGTLFINAASSYTGGTTLSGGGLRFGHKDAIGSGTFTIAGSSTLSASTNLTGVNAVMNTILLNNTLTFTGNNSLELGGAVTTNASRSIVANGTGGAVLTLSGLISQGTDQSLTLSGTGAGVISGGVNQAAGAASADIIVSSGNWTFRNGAITVADDLTINGGTVTLEDVVFSLNDDIIITGATAVLNLNTAGVWATNNPAGTSSGLFIRGGATVNLNANDVNGNVGGIPNSSGTEYILLADSTTVGTATLNTNTYTVSIPRLDVGAIADGYDGHVIGSGTIIGTGTAADYSVGFRLFRGSVSANLAGGSTILKQGLGDFTLSGDNSGLTGAVAASTRIDHGNLILDYTTSNTLKIPSNRGVDMRGGTLTINGNGSAATNVVVTSLVLTNGGTNNVDVNSNGFATNLNLGAISRGFLANDGTVRFEVPVLGSITTTTANNNFGILGSWATVLTTGGVVNYAANDGTGNIVAITSTTQDNVALWQADQHVTDSAGFSGSKLLNSVASIRFNANAASTVNVQAGGTLHLGTGGILMTSNAANGSHAILGGTITTSTGELIVIQDSTSQALTISSSISGTTGFTKAGAGSLILTGVNHYTGITDLQAGLLVASGGFAIGDNTVLTLADDHVNTFQITANETIGRLSGGSQTTGLETLATVDLGNNVLTLTVTAAASYNGKITGTNSIVIGGGGFQQTLIGNSTGFTGSVIISKGGLILTNIGAISASSFQVNGGGFLQFGNTSTTRSGTRVLDTASITLNSADGAIGGQTRPRGLYINIDQNATTSETVGVLTFGSGANYLTGEANVDSGTAVAIISAENFVRTNSATVSARGRAMGATAGHRNGFRIITANEAAFVTANLVGGGGAAGSKNISIVPWAIGETLTVAALADNSMGNSLVTYDVGAGFRALDFTSEYNTFATKQTNTDNIRVSLTANLTGIAGTTLNALVVNNNNTASSSINVTGTGAGQTLAVTSGALLFTLNPGADASSNHQITLGGFGDGITVGGTNEYVIHVVNPSSAVNTATLTTTISSSLTSTADITKSGRGTLILNAANTAGGGARKTTINEGVLEISALSNIGGNTGALVLAGGTLRLATGFVGDVSDRDVSILLGGGTIDTNGGNYEFARAIGGGGLGGLTKAGAGNLTLLAGATNTGLTTVANGRLIANGGGSNRVSSTAGLVVGSGTTSGVFQMGNANGASDQTFTELSTSGTGTANAIVGGGATASTLTVNQNTVTTYAGSLGGVGLNENNLSLIKSGVGILTLSGSTLTYTGTTTVSGGTLNITGSSSTALATSGVNVAGNATLNLLNGAGQAINLGTGTLSLGVGSGATVLGLELGSTSAYDSINSTVAAIANNSVVLNLTGLAGFGPGDYDLLTADSGLSGANYFLGSISGTMTGMTLNLVATDTYVRLTTATVAAGDLYWRGGVNNSWLGNSGTQTNFTTDLAGTINANATPGAGSTVNFSASNATGPVIATTLDGPFTINALRFLSSPTGVTTVTIAPGVAGSTLTIAPSATTDGISVADNAGAITISAPVILGASQTWNVVGTGANGSSLTVSGGVTGTGNITKTGAGTVTLLGSNTYAGTTTIEGGVWQAGVANGFNQTSAHTVNGTGILRLNNFDATIASLAGSGTVENAGTANARTLTTGGNNTSTVFSGTIQNGGAFALGLNKVGTGRMTLSGTNTYTGTTTINGGILEILGDTNTGAGAVTVGSGAGTRGMLYVGTGGALTTTDIDFGTNATGAGAAYQSDGQVIITGADGTNRFTLGNVASGYGYYNLSGGTLTSARFTVAGSNFAGATGVYEQTGGTATFATWAIVGHGSGNALVDVSGGNFNAGANFSLNHVSNSYSVMNVRGTGVISKTSTGAISLLQGNANSLNNVGIVNVLTGGVLAANTGGIINGAGTGSTGNIALLNLNGGTIRTLAPTATLINISGAALTATSGAYVYSGGVTIDTNGFDSTVPGTLRAPTGSGVQNIAVASGGTGYIGAPLIKITGGSGVGATAIANMVDDGTGNGTFAVGSITITNPGTGYLPTDVLTITFGDNSSVYVTQASLGAVTFNSGNVSGGLTKIGVGTLTLSGANTYTGGTTIEGGTLALGGTSVNVLADTGAVTVNGGVFDVNTRTETVGVVTLQNGSITGSTGVLTGSSYQVQNGLVTAILAGSGGLTKTTAGTVTLSGVNTFSGAVNVNGGVLAFSASANLGNASATNTVGIDGGTLSYTGGGSVNLGVNRSVTVGASGATVEVANSAGILTFAGNVSGSAGGSFNKTGAGTVILTGTNNLGAGGALNVAGGTLRGGFGTSGASTVTVSSTGTLEFVNGAAQALTLSGTSGALNLAGGATLGFELGGAGINDSIIVAAGGSAVTGGVITLNIFDLGGMASGTYTLIDILGGGSGLGSGLGSATFVVGNAPTGFNYVVNNTGSQLQLVLSVLIRRYWTGDQNGSWATNNAGNTNWASTADGLTDAGTTPGTLDTVIFSASNAAGPVISTTLDGNRTIDSLQFLAVPTGVTAVTIAQGTGGTLTLMPQTATNGIAVAANAGAITISAPLIAGNAQTWTVDATGASLVVSGNTTFNGQVTKQGGGALTLSGSNSGAGGVSLQAGTLNINSATALGTGTFTIGSGTIINNSTGAGITLTTNNAQVWDGSFTFTGTQGLNLGTGAVTLGNNVTVTTTANTLTVGGAIGDGASDFTLTKAGAGTLTLSGGSTWSGGMTLTEGTLNINNSAAVGTGGFTINGGTINNTSGAAITLTNNNAQVWNGNFTFTGTNNLNMGTGPVSLGTAIGTSRTVTVAAGNLTVGGAITNGTSAVGLTKAGAGTLTLSGLSTTAANNYSGTTTLGGGTLAITSNAVFSGGLTFGSAPASTTLSTLDLTTASATFNGPTVVQTNSTTANVINIGAGQTLQLNGSVVVGYDSNANTRTGLTVSGAGTLQVGSVGNPTNANFTLGGNTVATGFSNGATLDMSGLATFYANLGLGTFRIGDVANSGGGGNAGSTIRFAADSTVIANVFTSDSPDSGNFNQVIKLGSTSTVIHANSVNIGATSGRANSTMDFDASTGTLQIRAADGNGRAAMSVSYGAATTAAASTSTVNLAGHASDLLLSTLSIGGRTGTSGGSSTGTFTFDTGTLDVTGVTVGDRRNTVTNAGASTGTLNLNGGTITVGATGILIGNTIASFTGSTVEGTVNIGGDAVVTVGATSNVSITLGKSTVADMPAIATLNITGNSKLTVAGNIIEGTGAGNAAVVSTLTLNGGTLDMSNRSIGTATEQINNLNFQSGTLANVLQINGGAGLTKTTIGTLILEGLNAYTGGTFINAGILQVGSGGATGTLGSGTVSNNGTLRFNRNNTYTVSQNITGAGNVVQAGTGVTVLSGSNDYSGGTSINAGTLQVDSADALGTTGNISFGGGTLQHTANNTVDYSARIQGSTSAVRIDTNGQAVTYATALSATNLAGLTKEGTGTLTLNAANLYSGPTTVTGGTIIANNAAALSTGNVSVGSAGTLVVGDGSRLALTLGGSLSSSGTLQFDIFSRQAGLNPVGNNDMIVLTSQESLDSVLLTGTLDVNTTLSSHTAWQINDRWQLIDWSIFQGSIPAASNSYGGFSTLDLPTLGSGLSWQVITNTSGLYIAVVPEPSRAVLLILGFGLLILRRRRK